MKIKTLETYFFYVLFFFCSVVVLTKKNKSKVEFAHIPTAVDEYIVDNF
jgi:hypothetical protein